MNVSTAQAPAALTITLNGEDRRLDGPTTVLGLLEQLGFEPRTIAIERNLEIVPRSAYATTPLAPGDRIEIVKFVGGG